MKPSSNILKLYRDNRREIDEAQIEYRHEWMEGANGIQYYIVERYSGRICTGERSSYQEAWLVLIGKA